MKHTFHVRGMHCRSCVLLITEALEDEGGKNVTIQLDEKKQLGTVTLESEKTKAQLKEIIERQGNYVVQ